ncbi:MAG TPA: selenocysteine-specific translation elongation factor [Terriglobia bacterium]|nr:selenocysteine-specific translation elongation factor [Terriglobia bacterium]
MKDVIVGTAGHIDHGKSALVLALTGTDPDRLAEEKRRGITIDLGFAHLDLGDGVRVGLVDVPGHERFVRNMLAGASGIDLVMLVVAADESIKPQTREHFEICRLLGVRRGLVALTKRDLVDEELLETARLELREFVAGSFLEGAPIVAVSARTGEGLDELRTELKRLSEAAEARRADLPFRLPVDRSFVIHGFGAVVTGTLAAGRISRESEAEIFSPQGGLSGRRVRVRGIQVHNQQVNEAVAGQRTALNLAGVDAGEVPRGAVLGAPGIFQASDRFDCVLALLDSARPLKNRARVHLHAGTVEMLAEVVLSEGREMKPGTRAYAQLRLSAAGIFLPGDRFIIRQFSPVTTIGGGTVLDNRPQKHRAGDVAVQSFLDQVERADDRERLALFVREAGESSVSALGARLGWFPDQVLRAAEPLVKERHLIVAGRPPVVLISAEHFGAVSNRIIAALEAFHAANPLAPGLAREDLRGRLAVPATRAVQDRAPQAPPPSSLLFSAAIQALSSQGKLKTAGETVRLAGREVTLNAQESAAKESISRAFEQAALSVPAASEVLAKLPVDRARAEKILQILLREKTLVKVTEGLVFHRTALERLRALLAERKTRNSRLDVAAFKEMTGVTRKYAIPLLEYLDRERVTRREGEARIIL